MKSARRWTIAGILYITIIYFTGSATISAQSLTKIPVGSATDSEELTATVNVAKTGGPINGYVYGMFTELLGNIFEFGLWAEMLSDRKFFYPVDTTSKLNPINTRWFQHRWRPVGGDDDRQVVQIPPITEDYLKYPFSITAGADADSGRIEVTGTGTGSFRIGAVSLMPANNIQGFRSDLVALLRELNSGIYRWPGGNMLAGYDWRDGIGDIDRRPPRYDYAWNAVESNDVGTEEFIALCNLVNTDPYFCVNIGFGDAFSAAQWKNM